MTPRTIPNVIAVTPGGDITFDMLLGFITLYSVPDQPVSQAKFAKLWREEGLNENLIPDRGHPVDVFRQACRSIESKRTVNGSEKREEISVDPVISGRGEAVYQVTRLVRDRKERVIEHPKAMRITFDATKEAFTFDKLDDAASYAQLRPLGDQIEAYYTKNASRVPGSKVRTAIRAILDAQLATNIAGKSAYFVPRDGKGHLDSVAAVLGGLYGAETIWHTIPCANAEDERRMVEKHFAIDVSGSVDELMAEAAEGLKADKKMRSDRFGRLLQSQIGLRERAKAYAELLDNEQSEVSVKLALLGKQLDRLAAKVA